MTNQSLPRPLASIRDSLERLETAHPAGIALALVVLAALVREAVVVVFWDATFSAHMVKGVPVSDGRNWDTLAMDFAAGRKVDPTWADWGGKRPLYWIFMGAIYALTGPSMLVTRVVQVLLGALSTAIVFEVTRRLTSARLAVLAALAHALSIEDALFCLVPGTEVLGAFLANASLCAFVVGVAAITTGRDDRSARRGALGAMLASGGLLGLATLTLPQSVTALALWIPLVVLVAWRRAGSAGGRRGLAAATLVLVGCAMIVTPWLVHQRRTLGFWTLSSEASERFFAATSPEYGRWTGHVSLVAGSLPIAERYALFAEKARKNLREHPGFYLWNSLRHTGQFVSRLPVHALVAAATCAMFLLSAWGAVRESGRLARVGIVAAIVTAATLTLPDAWQPVIWLAGAALAVVRRHPMALLAAMIVVRAVTMGMAAASDDVRFTFSSQWMVAALGAWGLWQALELTARGRRASLASDAPASPPIWGSTARTLRWAAAVVALVWAIGLGRAVAAGFAVHPSPPSVVLARADAARWVADALESERAAPYRPLAARLEARRATIRPDYVMWFWAGDWVYNMSPLYKEPRLYSFQVFETRPPLPESHAVFPDSTPDLVGREVVLVGMTVPRHDEGTSFEVIAIGHANGGARASMTRPPRDAVAVHAAHLLALATRAPARPAR